ncbi:MAG: GAF domain-containing sensor histidine kinase [Candidatus Methylomirabilis oxyfera]|nr:GAF domain-containing sensor histidine kinase [Candidatus Methylomirabilis oxyfera]
MNLRWLKWLTVLLPATFLILLELVRQFYLEPTFTPRMGRFIAVAVMVVGVFAFSHAVFSLIVRMEQEILQRNRHLAATNQILDALAQSWDLDQVLPLALARLLEVVEVEFGMVCLLDEEQHELVALASQGVPAELAKKMARMKLGEGLEAQVIRSGKLEVIEDAAGDPGVMEGLKMLGVHSLILLPLKSKGRIRGLAHIGSQRQRMFSHVDVQLLQAMGSQIAMAIENSWLFTETRKQSERLRVLNELGIDLTAELSLDALLQKVVHVSRELVDARYGALRVLEGDGRIDRFLTSGLDPEEVARIGPPPQGPGLLGLLLKEGRPLRLLDIATHPLSVGFPPHHPPMKSFLGVPIISKGKVIGGLYLTDREGGRDFTQVDQDAVAVLAAQAAVAIENAMLYEQLQDLTTLRERQRIAMDLHDGVIQSIYAVGLNLEGCMNLTGGGMPEVKQRVSREVDHLNEVIKEIRNYIFDLRPDRSGTRTIKQILEDAVKELRVNALIEAELIAGELKEKPSREHVLQLSHIVREAIANIIKHAKATSVGIRLSSKHDHLLLSVKDNGVGFTLGEVTASAGLGLRNMEQRASSVGGRLVVKSAPGKGTEVTIRIPLVRNTEGTRDGRDTALDRGRS